MGEKYSQTTEDYLKAIYEITRLCGRATTNQIAVSLKVTPASVTGMCKKLSQCDPPLVEYKKHQGVLLTREGEKAALEVIRHHRLLEMFLHEKLGYDWDEVDAEADRLEHYISEIFEERIAELLGDPAFDPHGDPIPTRDLQIMERPHQALSELRAGEKGTVQRVMDDDPQLLRYLWKVGLVPRKRFIILAYSPLDENMLLQIEGKAEAITIGSKITCKIFVEVENE